MQVGASASSKVTQGGLHRGTHARGDHQRINNWHWRGNNRRKRERERQELSLSSSVPPHCHPWILFLSPSSQNGQPSLPPLPPYLVYNRLSFHPTPSLPFLPNLPICFYPTTSIPRLLCKPSNDQEAAIIQDHQQPVVHPHLQAVCHLAWSHGG